MNILDVRDVKFYTYINFLFNILATLPVFPVFTTVVMRMFVFNNEKRLKTLIRNNKPGNYLLFCRTIGKYICLQTIY